MKKRNVPAQPAVHTVGVSDVTGVGSRVVTHSDPRSGATWGAPAFQPRKFVLADAEGKPLDLPLDLRARTLRVWLEDGAEIHVELFHREDSLLNVRTSAGTLVVHPHTSNCIKIGERK